MLTNRIINVTAFKISVNELILEYLTTFRYATLLAKTLKIYNL